MLTIVETPENSIDIVTKTDSCRLAHSSIHKQKLVTRDISLKLNFLSNYSKVWVIQIKIFKNRKLRKIISVCLSYRYFFNFHKMKAASNLSRRFEKSIFVPNTILTLSSSPIHCSFLPRFGIKYSQIRMSLARHLTTSLFYPNSQIPA